MGSIVQENYLTSSEIITVERITLTLDKDKNNPTAIILQKLIPYTATR